MMESRDKRYEQTSDKKEKENTKHSDESIAKKLKIHERKDVAATHENNTKWNEENQNAENKETRAGLKQKLKAQNSCIFFISDDEFEVSTNNTMESHNTIDEAF